MAVPNLVHVSPSTAAVATATAILAGLGGYFIGQASSLGFFSSSSDKQRNRRPSNTPSAESDDTDDEGFQGELADFGSSGNEEYKLALVVRTDLGMGRGKMAAQCAHATLACYKTLLNSPNGNKVLRRWEGQGQTKVALQVRGEEELEFLQAQALSMGLCARVIRDAGRTQIAAGSSTVLGVGPGPRSRVDKVTGALKLL